MAPIRSLKILKNGRSARLFRQGETDVIPGKSYVCFIKRNIVEWFFARLKRFRGIATCCDKLNSTFLASVQLVATAVGIN
ncbi:transposase [Acetobacter musti]|uniref:Transposase n=1 Tax=Acetobacter musti TaxID=864732 RepID=A0ABX0JT64_9PROT|nr:transposase [Acetobacter musti]